MGEFFDGAGEHVDPFFNNDVQPDDMFGNVAFNDDYGAPVPHEVVSPDAQNALMKEPDYIDTSV